MFEVMPMLIGSELALKCIEMEKKSFFGRYVDAPLLSLHSHPIISITGDEGNGMSSPLAAAPHHHYHHCHHHHHHHHHHHQQYFNNNNNNSKDPQSIPSSSSSSS
jgi:hypothetical protein